MRNYQLITKNKKILIKKYFINLEAISDFSNKLIIKTIYSTCKHGTEKWVIEKKAHWLKYNRDSKTNYFTNNLKSDFKKEKNLGNMVVGKIIKVGSNIKLYKQNDIVLMYGSASDYQIAQM